MPLTVEAIYKGGRLELKQPVALREGAAVRLTITPLSAADEDPLADIIGVCDTGRADGAENHDKYLSQKRRS